MKFLKYALLSIISIFLGSCSLHHYALIPPPGNTDWNPDKDSAVILIGFTSDELLGGLKVAGDMEEISLASYLFPSNKLNAIAINFRAGESFRLTGVSYLVAPHGKYRIMKFENLHTLELKKPGIYYYGSFYSVKGKGGFDKKYDANVVKIANSMYAKVFAELKPINFR